ncbi:MAG: hypothetical protein ACP5NV_04735 [Candidatus Woesearchaeota archaeon]
MTGATILNGEILAYSFPNIKMGSSYKLYSKEKNIVLYTTPPNAIEKNILQTLEYDKTNKNKIYTPCVSSQTIDGSTNHRRAKLLIPPENYLTQVNLTKGLIVPDLKLSEVIKIQNHLIGYVLTSNYVGEKEFFAYPKNDFDITTDSNIIYQGVITDVPKDRNRRIVVQPILQIRKDSALFKTNLYTLEAITNSDLKLWWQPNISR